MCRSPLLWATISRLSLGGQSSYMDITSLKHFSLEMSISVYSRSFADITLYHIVRH
jgi:hypothetical protein